jgi:Transglutaminase-like superfamily
MADRWATVQVKDLSTGLQRVSQSFWLPLDDKIPWEVQIDPYHYADGVDPVKSPIPHSFPDLFGEGQTRRVGRVSPGSAKATKKGSFYVTPPATAIEYYDPRSAWSVQSLSVTFLSGGEIERMVAMMAKPLSQSWQKVTSATCSVQSAAGSSVLTSRPVDNPSKYPVYVWDRSQLPAAKVTMLASSVLELRNVRVDPSLLRAVTWKQLDDARKTQPYAFYASPEPGVIESNDPTITDFVHATLGADYRQHMTPYDAARRLFQAVLAHVTYYYPAPGQPDNRPDTAVKMLAKGFGDCGGFSILLVALYRNIGFAARTACGAWVGLDAGHCWSEQYFPGHGWVLSDGAAGNSQSESGEFAYYFGHLPDLNIRYANMRGNTFEVGDVDPPAWLQGPYERVWGAVHEQSVTSHTMLIQQLHLAPTGDAAAVMPQPRSVEMIQLAARRCPCASHGGFRPFAPMRLRVPALR